LLLPWSSAGTIKVMAFGSFFGGAPSEKVKARLLRDHRICLSFCDSLSQKKLYNHGTVLNTLSVKDTAKITSSCNNK
jgi:hypothetical protein